MGRFARTIIYPIANKIFHWKEVAELLYWKRTAKAEGVLSNAHYAHFYTTHFGLSDANYAGKTVLDIGCGPRGSLEWATMAARRIGVDPLANDYLRLGARNHAMEYIAAPCEAIPLDAGSCDIVCAFNSLDHVVDPTAAIAEIKRVTRRGGLFLLLVEVNHAPTVCEPHELTPDWLIAALHPEFACEQLAVYKIAGGGIYDSVRAGVTVSDPERTRETGYMSALFRST